MSAPAHINEFDAEAFLAYVRDSGGEVLPPTNPWEIARYRAKWRGSDAVDVHIVYKKANGRLTYTKGSEDHYRAFVLSAPMEELPKLSPKNTTARAKRTKPKTADLRRKLVERDGDVCWFCGCFLNGDETIEHLVAKARGGFNTLDNYALAHAECNRRAGSLPLVGKLALRQMLRESRADLPPWESTDIIVSTIGE